MGTGIYGRQWNNTDPEYAFRKLLLEADQACISGNIESALKKYKIESEINPIAKRRLNLAYRQTRLVLNRKIEAIDIINLAFVDWYQGYERDIKPYIISMFSKLKIKAKEVSVMDADIIIAGCYGQEILENSEQSKDKLVIFVSGENLSPSYNIHDFSITTRLNTYCGKNVRLPQWYNDIKIEEDGIYFNEEFNELPKINCQRDLMISAIYNNATPEREAMITILRNLFGDENVHIFGSHRGKTVDKMTILSRSKINVCFENSVGQGYTTEKLLHSKVQGCKSLYWGDETFKIDFADDNVLNTKSSNSMSEVINWCKKQLAESTDYKYQGNILQNKIFSQKPNMSMILDSLSSWSKLVLNWRNLYK